MIMIPYALLILIQEIHFCPQTSLEQSSFFQNDEIFIYLDELESPMLE